MLIQPTSSGSSSASESNGLRLAICDTAVATTDKIAALDDFELSVGAMINVKFTATDDYNTEVNTLNVNNTGAKTIAVYAQGRLYLATGSKPFRNGNIHTFIYDGTYWVCVTANPWRPVCDDLTSDSATDSLSANQGKVLKDLIDTNKSEVDTALDGKLSSDGGVITGNMQQSGPTTDYDTFKFRNISFGTSSTPPTDATYGGNGSIYLYYK